MYNIKETQFGYRVSNGNGFGISLKTRSDAQTVADEMNKLEQEATTLREISNLVHWADWDEACYRHQQGERENPFK